MGCNTISDAFDCFSAVPTEAEALTVRTVLLLPSLSLYLKPHELEHPLLCDLNEIAETDLGFCNFVWFVKTRVFWIPLQILLTCAISLWIPFFFFFFFSFFWVVFIKVVVLGVMLGSCIVDSRWRPSPTKLQPRPIWKLQWKVNYYWYPNSKNDALPKILYYVNGSRVLLASDCASWAIMKINLLFALCQTRGWWRCRGTILILIRWWLLLLGYNEN